MEQLLTDEGYIPLDKSWIIRMGVLDATSDRVDCINFLHGLMRKKSDLVNDDLRALYHASVAWRYGDPIDVGESGTLYRFLRFASWKLGRNDEFVKHGTLAGRKMSDDPAIVNLSLDDLLQLDNGTSQWASAAVLMGNTERPTKIPFKLQVTYDAVDHWNTKRSEGGRWQPRYDETILAQAVAYLDRSHKGRLQFTPQQAEDYCFARAFDLMTPQEGEQRWSSLRGHESDRITEMEKELTNMKEGRPIESKDHRVVQAMAMLYTLLGKKQRVLHPESVAKSWPQFWKFLEDAPKLT
jgi:hypothetical protein